VPEQYELRSGCRQRLAGSVGEDLNLERCPTKSLLKNQEIAPVTIQIEVIGI
jgi:hypothetical protein